MICEYVTPVTYCLYITALHAETRYIYQTNKNIKANAMQWNYVATIPKLYHSYDATIPKPIYIYIS